MTDIIIKWAIPFVLGGLISSFLTYLKMKTKKNIAVEDGVRCLLRAEIISSHERYSTLGTCPIYAKESLRRMYHAYHELGGNDVATNLYEKTLDLPDN